MEKIIFLVIGSAAGGLARWVTAEVIGRLPGGGAPYGTLAANLLGCLLVGLFYGMGETRFPMSPSGRMLLIVGFCGAFTTFSTFMMETSALLDRGNSLGAAAYLLASMLLGLTLFRAGTLLSRAVSIPAGGEPSSVTAAERAAERLGS